MSAEHIDEPNLWAYLHDELSGPARNDVERALQQDPALQRRFERMKALDGNLRRLMPLTEGEDESLVRETIEAWELDRAPRRAPAAMARRPFLTVLGDLLTPPPGIRMAYALAALALVALGARNYMAGPLGWSRPDLIPVPQYRGGEPAPKPVYSKEALATCAAELENSIRTHYREVGTEGLVSRVIGRKSWALSCRIEVLPGDRLLVRIQAAPPNARTPARDWSAVYPTLSDLQGKTDSLGATVARELGQPKQTQ